MNFEAIRMTYEDDGPYINQDDVEQWLTTVAENIEASGEGSDEENKRRCHSQALMVQVLRDQLSTLSP